MSPEHQEKLSEQDVVTVAEAIARRAHRNQMYGDRDYVDAHVSQVASITERLGYGDLFVASAWLHDVLEDTDVSADELFDAGIPETVISAVEALTERDGEARENYLMRISVNQIAIAVKYADASANFSSTMLLSPYLSVDEFRDWSDRYARTIAFLIPLLPQSTGPENF